MFLGVDRIRNRFYIKIKKLKVTHFLIFILLFSQSKNGKTKSESVFNESKNRKPKSESVFIFDFQNTKQKNEIRKGV